MKRFLIIAAVTALLVPTVAWAIDVEGKVTSASGEGLSRALLVLSQNGEEVARVATNSDGRFVVRDLPAGRYTVKVTYRGESRTFTDVEVTGESLTFRF